jgi:hypothetical protein
MADVLELWLFGPLALSFTLDIIPSEKQARDAHFGLHAFQGMAPHLSIFDQPKPSR